MKQERLDRIISAMKPAGAGQTIVSDPLVIGWLTGIGIVPGERMLALLLKDDGTHKLIVNALFPQEETYGTDITYFSDTDDGVALLFSFMDKGGTVAVDKNWPARFLLRLIELDPGAEFINSAPVIDGVRLIKDAGEIDCVCRAGEIASRAFDRLLEQLRPGMTEKQAQILLDYEMLNLGSEGRAFDTIAAAGVNGSLPHAIPSDYVIREGDLLTLDFGATVGGYCSDVTRTVAFGRVSPELRAIYDLVYDAHMAALEAVRPGAMCGDVDRIARDMIDGRYSGAFGHSLGHGVGLFIHEQPRVAKGSQTVLESGHVITIEPGVYIPGLGGCRIEDTVILTDDGFIDPITSPKQFIAL